MKEFIKSVYDKENNPELYVFNVIHTVCIVGMLFVCCISRIYFEDIRAVYLSIGICVLFVLTMAEGNRTLAIKRSVVLMSVAFNFVYMPIMYYLFNRNINVIPIYFLFGLMYSVLLLEPKIAAVLGVLEILFYCVFLTLSRDFAPTGLDNPTAKDIFISYSGTIVAVAIVGICAGSILRFRFSFYEKAHEEAERLKAEAMDAYIAKDMFLINMSHEIRTPMNAIVGNVDLLLDQDVNERVSDSVYNILNSCNALLSITDELMDLSKSESGNIELFSSTYDLSDLLMEVINMMAVRLTESNLEFFVEINKSLPRFLYGDASKLRQLFVNILNNAVKFTKSGHISLRVDYRLIDNDSIELIVDVEDTGIGIKKEDIATLFQKQKTDDESDTDSTIDGSGLGLSICYEIIREMKGDISVRSEYMAGSTFTIKIPQKFTSMDTIAYIPDSRALRILVFEKDKTNATFIGRILDSFDIECDFAQNTQDLERLMNVNSYSYVFVANERYNECESVLNNRLVSERVVAFCKLDDNVQISKATTVLTRPIHALNIAALLKNESNSYVRDVTRKGGFECPMATILVVDDNYTNLNVAAALLSKYRANVLTALSGADCLRIIKDQEVDMVFLDYMMPEMNGIDTLERIRKIPGSNIASMPVIALTANVVSGAREMFLEAGFDDFLAKPISIDKMEKILRKYLRRELLVPKNSSGAKQI